jgi:hypothetical protein
VVLLLNQFYRRIEWSGADAPVLATNKFDAKDVETRRKNHGHHLWKFRDWLGNGQGLGERRRARLHHRPPPDFAYNALHETFLLLDRVTDAMSVRSPADYIFRTAISNAKDRQVQNYHVSASEIDALLGVCDEEPDRHELPRRAPKSRLSNAPSQSCRSGRARYFAASRWSGNRLARSRNVCRSACERSKAT